jgi:hypothetical protein
MSDEINGNHIVIYYDADMKEADGLGWCVELHPSSTTNRFATLADAQLFITDNSWYFLPSIHVVKS